MTDLESLKSLDEKTRQLIGLYAAEKTKAEKLLRSMACIDAWADCAINHLEPIGNNYRVTLQCIQREVQAAIKTEGSGK